jgi:hypothetical protein
MSLSQNDSAGEQPAATEPFRLGVEPERRRVPYPEGPPIMSLLAAALISFVFLATANWTMFPFLADFLNVGGGMGPLSLPTLSDNVLLEAPAGTAVLTIISLTILLAERHGTFPGLQPIMPLDLPVKVRSWELTVYPRSHIRRWFGVTRPAQARM